MFMNRCSVQADGKVGCGGIIRDKNRTWLGGFFKHIEKFSITITELRGVLEGLLYFFNR